MRDAADGESPAKPTALRVLNQSKRESAEAAVGKLLPTFVSLRLASRGKSTDWRVGR